MSLVTDERALSRVDRRGLFFTASAVLYAILILASAWTLNPYFAQTWDVATFIHAAQSFLGASNPLDLYAQSRAAQTWPYAYPPLHAIAVAVALVAGKLVPMLPDFVAARMPAVAADIGIALVLYRIVERQSGEENLARAAFLVWLFNPVTFYDTAVQGHFESEWLLPVLLAYLWTDESRGIVPISLALAVGVLFKQVAILFAIPVWVGQGYGGRPVKDEGILLRMKVQGPPSGDETNPSPIHLLVYKRLVFSVLIFACVVGIVCLPFLLYSNDFLYMNLTYVENVPVQTQSWVVALLGLTRSTPTALTSDFVLLKYQTVLTMAAAVVVSIMGSKRKWSLYLTGTLIALAFFITSKKVMGYYYVMLLPFLLAECLPRRRLGPVLAAVVATTWIALSPYYAAWGNPAHWWIYALLGTANSVFFLWLGWKLVEPRNGTPLDAAGRADLHERENPGTLVSVTLGLFAAAVGAALLQPLVGSQTSPIRAPVVEPEMAMNAAAAFVLLVALVAAAVAVVDNWTRQGNAAVRKYVWALVLVFAPVFFAVYTLTKEATAIFEIVINALGG